MFNAHVRKPRHGARRVIGVQCTEDQVPCERRAHGDLCGLQVANLAHHDDVRILPDDVPQSRGKSEANLRVDLNLVYTGELVFYWILNSNNFFIPGVQFAQRTIESCGFAAPGWPRNQEEAVRQT